VPIALKLNFIKRFHGSVILKAQQLVNNDQFVQIRLVPIALKLYFIRNISKVFKTNDRPRVRIKKK
jgi:hypothetical protein